MIKIHNKQEQGRSMTEMLGVLAIIGVLSIGGIAGYTYAMERHYTNEILNAASQRAIVIASQIAAGRQLSLTEFDGQKEVAGGTFDSTVVEWDDEFGIKVTGVKESVCQKLLKATEGTDVILAKQDGSDFAEADCAGGSFLITYSNDLGKGGEGGGTATCESPMVEVYDCETKTTTDCCPDNGNTCEQPSCSCDDDDDCPGYQRCEDKQCTCPGDGELKGDVCCLDVWAWDGSSYSGINIEACGCPMTEYGAEKVGNVCCYNNKSWGGNDYDVVNIEACGCPPDDFGNYGTKIGDVCCSSDKKAWDGDSYDAFNLEVCGGCPETGWDPIDGVCCYFGKAWDGSSYSGINIEACGCPDGVSEPINGICCYSGKAWDGDSYDGLNIEVCGCPFADGGYTPVEPTNGSCCYNGLGWDGTSYFELKPDECGCPWGGSNNGGVCCSSDGWSWNGSSYNGTNIEACGCPVTGLAPVNGICCWEGRIWNGGYLDLDERCS